MTDINTLQQLKNRIAEMECHHMEELRKLKADHGQLEVRIKRLQGRTTDQHPFIDRIREADIPLGWKPLNLEQYDETIDPHEHPDAFLT
ncbi:hypothetical protein JHK84_027687 [Glycine max]|nr:hypothetical protein JHK86_027563 [Glycine max]KAG5151215.1 hypothetical protein JHK84_027687 [Glycine max]